MKLPDAIARVLDSSTKPLTGIEIARQAIFEGWIKERGDFPSHSVADAIQRHLQEGNSRGFRIYRGSHRDLHRYWLLEKSRF